MDIKNKRISILGLAFKPNTDDVRDSASITMINAIKNDGGLINAYDPVANESMRKIFEEINYFNSWEEACKDVDAVAILTEWNEFRGLAFTRIKRALLQPTIIDLRNIYDPIKMKELGFNYTSVGRRPFN